MYVVKVLTEAYCGKISRANFVGPKHLLDGVIGKTSIAVMFAMAAL